MELQKKAKSQESREYLIKRIGEEDIEINQIERDGMLRALEDGDNFVEVKGFILMVNAIKSIDPVICYSNLRMDEHIDSEGRIRRLIK